MKNIKFTIAKGLSFFVFPYVELTNHKLNYYIHIGWFRWYIKIAIKKKEKNRYETD